MKHFPVTMLAVGGLLLMTVLIGCSTTTGPGSAYTLGSADEYRTLGIDRGRVAAREDGMRTSGDPGTYEWWYFDATLQDGSTLVIVFYTKDAVKPDTPLKPRVTLEWDRPDGTRTSKDVELAPAAFSASRDSCDVRIGRNSFVGDLHSYTIHVAVDEVVADIQLVGEVPAWRPQTGVSIFKNQAEHYFAWLPSVPQGTVSGTLSIAGKTETVSGTGYHDHNWGDTSMLKLIHDWYWGRARVGEYTVIASYITAAEAYGKSTIRVFMLAKDGRIIADDSTKVKFSAEDVHVNTKTGKPVASTVIYDYDDGARHYRVTFRRQADLLESPLIDQLQGLERFLAALAGFDGAYLRFTGSATVESLAGTDVMESVSEKSAVWELMYFGHAPTRSR